MACEGRGYGPERPRDVSAFGAGVGPRHDGPLESCDRVGEFGLLRVGEPPTFALFGQGEDLGDDEGFPLHTVG
jgi:hypothetical protein